MDKIPFRVQQIIDRYMTALRENNVPIRHAILFGSYAQGKYKEWSDIDIALVSDIFEGKRFEDRGKIRKINICL